MDNVVPFAHPPADVPTAREREILNYIWAGLTSHEIAARLSIAPKTVESHRANLLRKFRAANVAQLLRLALLEGVLDLPTPRDTTAGPAEASALRMKGARKVTDLA